MTSSDFKRYLSEKHPELAKDTLLIIYNLIDTMPKWVPESELPEALADILDGTSVPKGVVQDVTEYSHNKPTEEQHTLIFGIAEIYERFFDNFFRKGRSLWLPTGQLHTAYEDCEHEEFWESLNAALEKAELPELNMKTPPKYKTVQFYEDSAFKEWYHESAVTLLNWLDSVTTIFCRFIADSALQGEE